MFIQRAQTKNREVEHFVKMTRFINYYYTKISTISYRYFIIEKIIFISILNLDSEWAGASVPPITRTSGRPAKHAPIKVVKS